MAALAALVAVSLAAMGLSTASPAAASAARSTISCPAPTGGGVGTGTGGSCSTVTGTAADGTTALRGDVTYTTCGVLPACATVTLTVTARGATAPLASGSVTESPNALTGSGTIPLTLPATAPNGTYTAALTGDGATATATVRLSVPPSPVTFAATDTTTPGRATVHWAVSAPTPATAYALDVDGRPTTVVPACSAGRCSGTVSGLSGGHVFQVVASRPGGDGAAPLRTTALTTATVKPAPAGTTPPAHGSIGTVVGAPTASSGGQPTGSNGGTGTGIGIGTGAGTGTGTSAGTSGGGRQVVGAAPRTGTAALPPLPQLPSGTTSGDGEPTDPGTYSSRLPYARNLNVRTKVPRTTALGHVENVISDRALLEALAAALLLALLAAHLRVLARRPAADL